MITMLTMEDYLKRTPRVKRTSREWKLRNYHWVVCYDGIVMRNQWQKFRHETVRNWLKQNSRGGYSVNNYSTYFVTESDALMFYMAFQG